VAAESAAAAAGGGGGGGIYYGDDDEYGGGNYCDDDGYYNYDGGNNGDDNDTGNNGSVRPPLAPLQTHVGGNVTTPTPEAATNPKRPRTVAGGRPFRAVARPPGNGSQRFTEDQKTEMTDKYESFHNADGVAVIPPPKELDAFATTIRLRGEQVNKWMKHKAVNEKEAAGAAAGGAAVVAGRRVQLSRWMRRRRMRRPRGFGALGGGMNETTIDMPGVGGSGGKAAEAGCMM
jgi:hypothetical protein